MSNVNMIIFLASVSQRLANELVVNGTGDGPDKLVDRLRHTAANDKRGTRRQAAVMQSQIKVECKAIQNLEEVVGVLGNKDSIREADSGIEPDIQHTNRDKINSKNLVDVRRRTSTYVDVRGRTSTYVDVRGRTSTYVDVRRRTYVDVRRRTWTYVDVRGRTSTYVDVRPSWREYYNQRIL